MENEKLMTDINEISTDYIASNEEKIPGATLALISMILAIISAASAIIVGFLNFVIIVMTFLSYFILLPLAIPVLCFIPLLFAIAAIVFSKMAKNKGNKTRSVKVGFILGIISTVYWGIVNVLTAAAIIVIIVGIVLLFIIGILSALFTGFLGALVTGATAFLSILAPLVTILTPVLTIIAGILTAVGGDAVTEIIAYLYEFLMELFNTYVVNGAALVSWII